MLISTQTTFLTPLAQLIHQLPADLVLLVCIYETLMTDQSELVFRMLRTNWHQASPNIHHIYQQMWLGFQVPFALFQSLET